MNFELEKIFAKVSGENVENFAERILTDSEKAQIKFAFNQIFSGLSTIEWMNNVTLKIAWTITLDKMRRFIFSLPEKNYVVDYLQVAVFEHRKHTLKILESSMHINEYIQIRDDERAELEKSANEKIQTGINIIKNLLSAPRDSMPTKENVNMNENILQMDRQREYEHERTRK